MHSVVQPAATPDLAAIDYREGGVPQQLDGSDADRGPHYTVVEINVHHHLIVFFRLVARVFSTDKCMTSARIKAMSILKDGDRDPNTGLNFKGLLHESLVDILSNAENGALLKAKVEEFVDNLSRPTRHKVLNMASEPGLRFISPSMRNALKQALMFENNPESFLGSNCNPSQQFNNSFNSLRRQLYDRVERWDGNSSIPYEELPQLMVEGVMGRLGLFSLHDLSRVWSVGRDDRRIYGDVQHLTSCNDEAWIHALLHWTLVLGGTTNTYNRQGVKQKYSGWLADKAKAVYQPMISFDRVWLAQREHLSERVHQLRIRTFSEWGLFAAGPSKGKRVPEPHRRPPTATADPPPPPCYRLPVQPLVGLPFTEHAGYMGGCTAQLKNGEDPIGAINVEEEMRRFNLF